MVGFIPHFIGGERVAHSGGRVSAVFDPATGEQSGVLPLAGAEIVGAAVARALQAFPEWASFTPLRRARVLNKFLRILEERTDDLAKVITAEHGKTLPDARGEV